MTPRPHYETQAKQLDTLDNHTLSRLLDLTGEALARDDQLVGVLLLVAGRRIADLNEGD